MSFLARVAWGFLIEMHTVETPTKPGGLTCLPRGILGP